MNRYHKFLVGFIMLGMAILSIIFIVGLKEKGSRRVIDLKDEINISSCDNLYIEENEKDKSYILDIDKWSHPIKKYFLKNEIIKIELLKNNTYPIFFVNHNISSRNQVINNYLDKKILSMLIDNGFWDFEIRGIDEKSIIIKGDKKGKKVKKIILDGKTIDICKCDYDVECVLKILKSKIIKKDDVTEYYSLRSPYCINKYPDSDEDFYRLCPITYDERAKAYVIMLSRKSDTVVTYFYVRIDDKNIYLYYGTPSLNVNNDDFIEVEEISFVVSE